jgi:hypothetical protein
MTRSTGSSWCCVASTKVHLPSSAARVACRRSAPSRR